MDHHLLGGLHVDAADLKICTSSPGDRPRLPQHTALEGGGDAGDGRADGVLESAQALWADGDPIWVPVPPLSLTRPIVNHILFLPPLGHKG